MKHAFAQFRHVLFALLLMMPWAVAGQDAKAPRCIPYKPDPPIAIDGELGDWSAVPNAWPLAAGVTARAAWREECMFIAVEGTQKPGTQTVCLMVKGNDGTCHVFAFNASAEPATVSCLLPEGGKTEGVARVSKRTAQGGWTLEAAAPCTLVGLDKPKNGTPLHLEVRVSDAPPETGWPAGGDYAAVLTGTDGKAPAAPPVATVFSELRLDPGKDQTFTFDAPRCPDGQIAVLSMLARLDFKQVAGYAGSLRLKLNGKTVEGERMLNKPPRVKARSGDLYSMVGNDIFSSYYSPDFSSPDTHPHYGPVDKIEVCRLELNVSGLLAEGGNTLVVEHAAPTNECALVAASGELRFMPPPPPPKPKAGAPTGPLPRIAPRPVVKTVHNAQILPEGVIGVDTGNGTVRVESRFSTPQPGWVTGDNSWFKLERTLDVKEDHVVVHDTFTNLAGENLPLMRRSEIKLGGDLAALWLGGLDRPGREGTSTNPANPTTYAATSSGGIGLMAFDDVSRIHTSNYAREGVVGLADNELVLAPGATHRAVWLIIPTAAPDYWAFINTARRAYGANFKIDGAFAFLRADPNTDKWTDEQVTDFIRFKDAKYASASISYPMYKGRYTHGTSFQQIPLNAYKNSFARWKKLVPDLKTMVYFHCFIDVTDEGPETFADARLIGSDGTHANYGVPHDRIYIPTELNSYGKAVGKNVDLILDDIKADGVYWDEHEYSRFPYHYGDLWDGCSGDIDPAKMTVTRLKASVTLLSEPWRVTLARKILARGPLIGNGPPFTRAMAVLQFPCFVETGSITNCVQAHLWSPIALGDHLSERSETDAYRVMLGALDFGCVYHWYNDLTVIPTHHHLTRYMYPITPVELHGGYIIGEERIVTKQSGLYGWDDASEHEVHVFDDTGREVENFNAPLIREDGNTWTELRIAEDWSAAIVRK